MASVLLLVASAFVFISVYLWHLNRALDSAPPEAQAVAQKPWTEKEIRAAYATIKETPIDVRSSIPSKLGRRYIVVGGSGLVGGWIVQHLLWRGEDPAAIRILDLNPPARSEVAENNVQFLETDVTNPASVSKAFQAPWPTAKIAKLPLTVFHSASIIRGFGRTADFLPIYEKVNVGGTRNVLEAAKAAGTTCFIATSSGSVSQRPPHFWMLPWQRWPKCYFQYIGNADVRDYNGPVDNYGSCYAYSKAKAEKIVRDADDKASGFRTGCIRPGHAIYGEGLENSSSISWDYLRRGGSPTWIANMTNNFVHVQNVSIGHLCLERALIKPDSPNKDVGGEAYCITDPNPPIRFGDFYNCLVFLTHPSTPIAFPLIPPVTIFLICHVLEWYSLFQVRIGQKMGFKNLIEGDLEVMQPSIFQLCTIHLVYRSDRAEKEIGFKAPIKSLDGFCMAIADWNAKAEAKVQKKEVLGNGSVAEMGKDHNIVPKVADAH